MNSIENDKSCYRELCQCGGPELWLRQMHHRILFDARERTFRMLSCDSRWEVTLLHCFWCGGKLTHAVLANANAVGVDRDELTEISGLLCESSIHEIRRKLGAPDMSSEFRVPSGYPSERERSTPASERWHVYKQKWRSAVLYVIEFECGGVRFEVQAARDIKPKSAGS